MTTRFLKEEFENFFEFLDELRERGVTNMFGATPYLEDRFDLDRPQAKQALTAWMSTFGDGTSSPSARAERACNESLEG
jgi:hypothetical protein